MEQLMKLSDQELRKRAEYFGLTIQEPINRGRLIEELAEAEAIAQTTIEQGEVYQPGDNDDNDEGDGNEEEAGEGEEEEGDEEKKEELRKILNQTYKVPELRELLKQAGVKIPAKALKDDLIELFIENVAPNMEKVESPAPRRGLPLQSDLETLNEVRQDLNPEPINPNATFQQNRPLPPPALAPLATVKMPILKAPGRAPIVITTTGAKVTTPAPVMITPTTTPPEEETVTEVVPVPIPVAAPIPKATPKLGIKINVPLVKTPAKTAVPVPKVAPKTQAKTIRTPSPAPVATPEPVIVTVPKVTIPKATPKLGLKINVPIVTSPAKAAPKAQAKTQVKTQAKAEVPIPTAAPKAQAKVQVVRTPSPVATPKAQAKAVVVPVPVLTPVATGAIAKAAPTGAIAKAAPTGAIAKTPKLTLAKTPTAAAPKLKLTIATGTPKAIAIAAKATPKMAPPKSPVAVVEAGVEEGVLPFLSEEQVKRKKIDDLKKDFQAAGIDFKGVKLKNDFVQLYLKNMAPAVAATPSPSPVVPKRQLTLTTKTTLPTGTIRPIGGMTLPPPQFPAIIPKVAPEIERETVFEATIPIFETRMSPLPLPEPEQVTGDDQAPAVLTTEQMAFLGLGDIDPKRLTKTRVKKEDEAKYYSREDMINIARGLNLRVTGTKAELYDRIMDKLRAAGYVKD